MPELAAATTCPQCGTQIGAGLLACPGCQRLVHSDKLKRLAGEAEAATKANSPTDALSAWRSALELLPPDSRQAQVIREKMAALGTVIDTDPDAAAKAAIAYRNSRPAEKSQAGADFFETLRKKGILGSIGLLVLIVLTKSKWALSLFTLLLSLGVYWQVFGWKLAVGLMVSIYIHEMGHVVALRRFGIAATAPMFLPGLGAIVRLKQYPATPREEARVGLAGPWAGTAAAVSFYVLSVLGDWPFCAAIAQLGAVINLFNLVPIGPLDGGRGFKALSRPQRWLIFLAAAALLYGVWRHVGQQIPFYGFLELMLIFICVFSFGRALGEAPERGDRKTFWHYLFLLIVLFVLTILPAPAVVAPLNTPASSS